MKKRRLWWLVVPGLLLALVAVFFLGPRADSSPVVPSLRTIGDVEDYLVAAESRYSDIVPGTEKTVFWAGEPRARTDVSIVYLHGFSGSWQEMVPAGDLVAQRLGANIFYTRYTGHGRGADPLGDATLQDWVNDTTEAITVGRSIGEFEVISDLHRRYSTPRFPSSALVTMMAAVDLGRNADLESMTTPLLCLYSSEDDVVSLDLMREAFDRIGSSEKELREISTATGHVLAGDTHSPESTGEFVDAVVEFLERVR